MKIEKHIDVTTTGSSAADLLCESTDLSKQLIKQVMTKGAVWITRNNNTVRIRRADKKLQIGDSLHFYYDEDVLAQHPKKPLLIADEHVYSIWYKPSGMLSQGSKWGDHCTINRWVEKNHQPQRPAIIVHRLDRAATGLIIIAHEKKVAGYFSRLFENRQIEKSYQAVVCGLFPDNKSMTTQIDGKVAISHANRLQYNTEKDRSLVAISIETGRKHQIRRHLSELGYPILGDRLYGKDHTTNEVDLCLTACYLGFQSPIDPSPKRYTLAKQFLPSL